KSASTPIDVEKPLLKDPDGEDVDVHTYRSMIDDAEGVDWLPNEKIFTGLARMGYEKPSTKLTFYKAFFSSQYKFLIHTILQSLSAKLTSWNEFSSAMTFAVICLSTDRKFNFSKYIFDSLVKNVDISSKFYMYPRIGKGFSGVETPLFEGMLVVREDVEADIGEEQILDDTAIAAAQEVVTTAILEDVLVGYIPSPAPPTPPPQSSQDIPSTSQAQSPPQQPQSPTPAQPQGANFPMSLLQTALDACAALTLRRVETSDDTIMEDVSNQGMMIVELDRDEVEVVTTTKLITEVVNAASTPVSAARIIIPTAKQNIPVVTITAAPVKVAAASTRRRRGVVTRDPEEESSAKTFDETKSKDKGKGKSYDDIRPIFEAQFNTNMEFLLKSKEQIEEEESKALESINETLAQKAAKRRRLN
nr:glutamic acid-rich protein-like [Tanacetum cinerariifolium]